MSEKKEKSKKGYFAELDAARKTISEHETNVALNKKAKQKLSESVSLLNSFFNSPGAMRGVVEVEGNDIRHITDNSSTAEFFGRAQESMRNMLASQMGVDQEFLDIWIKHYEKSKYKKQQVNFEYEHKTDKQNHYFSVTVNYLGESDRGFSRYTYVLFDITELKQAQKSLQKAHDELDRRVEKRTAELAQSNEQLKQEIEERKQLEQKLIESRRLLEETQALAHLGSWEWDVRTNANIWSDEMYRIFGQEPGSFVPNYDAFADALHPADKDRMLEAVHRSVKSGLPYAEEYRIIRPDGTERFVYANGEVQRDEQGRAVRAVGAVLDITERKETEKQRRQLESQLHQALKMEAIGTLAGGIAHQFNNALLGITGNLDLLELDSPDRESITGHFEQMRSSTSRMMSLTMQLLAYARGGKYHSKTIPFSGFVRDTLLLIEHTIKPSAYIETDLPHDILSIKADLTQMQMVISTILSNASEAIKDTGRIRVKCRNEKITDETVENFPGIKSGQYVKLMIEDDGCGMDEETRNRIFEPFFTTKFHGRGLGLAAAYGIINNHDGWISVDSELGKGTTVTIYLPGIKDLKMRKGEPKKVLIKGAGTILLIEDEEMVMDVSRALLERLGYRVLEAKTGKEALHIAKTFDGDIDLAFLDIVLPDMGGKKIYPLLMETRPKLKVILCSGYSVDGPAQEMINAGAQGFIQKPFNLKSLSEKLSDVLEEK